MVKLVRWHPHDSTVSRTPWIFQPCTCQPGCLSLLAGCLPTKTMRFSIRSPRTVPTFSKTLTLTLRLVRTSLCAFRVVLYLQHNAKTLRKQDVCNKTERTESRIWEPCSVAKQSRIALCPLASSMCLLASIFNTGTSCLQIQPILTSPYTVDRSPSETVNQPVLP